ncbi:UDP-N-acetylmuramoyl-L-alanyl-D-glutamate--2,6-diaminopimelate ligase [Psychroflexus planctonicus]|uniref:UDP-N-acetylmuramoyl-L-alanyl-D-glutamate--2,6-diaminopimelate ligase n=1 Tax=Psychroflexus planctonicus TaxID=1526575 RepID=A0ABQ1SH34_9FLAO|nr:UDP-N-acetylmuramoyl-L-alanyl-D-glutamate--2,6-diaminopimelate ligase [Psychroflexus planctonicus]GGE39678.1 UDP-N-acetylmuramoyl-L-alanyl-D-glutamate--2,6-diaminopimelate ligase [Psychroflexus planctonicus]
MNTISDILYRVPILAVEGNTSQQIRNIHIDSTKVGLNDMFIAIKGTATDAHQFIPSAINQGALAVVCETLPENRNTGVTYIQVEDSRLAAAYIAANFYDHPSSKMKLIGITGTNGKTTVSSLLFQLFKNAGFKVGLISTVVIKVNDQDFQTKLTTPDSLTINMYLDKMLNEGVEYVFMEASSHGIVQHRTKGLHFAGAVFTNLSHDHLDYHKTFADYRDAKKILFDELSKSAFALTNQDDKNGEVMLQNTRAKKLTYSLKSHSDYTAKVLENNFNGMLLKMNETEVWSPLIGSFNAYNLLAVFAVADALGVDRLENLRLISELKPVSGRFQHWISDKQKITAIVDYAHTPDALENVLSTINAIRTKNEELFTVVGCGGDRDATKRPLMARIAGQLSTQVILTSDNPRTENPDAIIQDMEKGIEPTDVKKVLTITSREQAIKTACKMAKPQDIILIAGKGHETYQEINGVRSDFDDFKKVKNYLKEFDK